MNQGHSQNMSHVSVDVNLMVASVTQDKNGTMISVSASVKNQYRVCENDYDWNPSRCSCKCDKNCHIGENLKSCKGI